jgi:hypothetical protein
MYRTARLVPCTTLQKTCEGEREASKQARKKYFWFVLSNKFENNRSHAGKKKKKNYWEEMKSFFRHICMCNCSAAERSVCVCVCVQNLSNLMEKWVSLCSKFVESNEKMGFWTKRKKHWHLNCTENGPILDVTQKLWHLKPYTNNNHGLFFYKESFSGNFLLARASLTREEV